MEKRILAIALMICTVFIFSSCGGGGSNGGGTAEMENTDLVPSGTYTGTAEEVDPEEREIYVKTTDNKTLELYFTDQTRVTQNGQSVSFDALKKGQKVEVTVEKKGKRLEPMTVKIME